MCLLPSNIAATQQGSLCLKYCNIWILQARCEIYSENFLELSGNCELFWGYFVRMRRLQWEGSTRLHQYASISRMLSPVQPLERLSHTSPIAKHEGRCVHSHSASQATHRIECDAEGYEKRRRCCVTYKYVRAARPSAVVHEICVTWPAVTFL